MSMSRPGVAEKANRARNLVKVEAYELIMNSSAVVGGVYKKGGASLNEYGPLVFALGG